MTFLRAIRDDLVEKRLWPVAVVLLLALVAVPVVLGRGSEEAAPPPPLPDPAIAAAPVQGAAAPPVVLAEASTAGRKPTGQFKDPFRRPAGAPDETEPASVTTVTPVQEVPKEEITSTGAGGTPTTEPVTASPEPEPAGATPAVAPDPEPDPVSAARHAAGYRVDLDWGPAADAESEHDVARLAALDAEDEPAVIFMGVRPDGRSALFLLLGDSAGSGDARCRPTADMCRLLEMRAGDTQFIDVVTAEGVRQYELHVDRVAERDATTEAAAEDRLERVSKAGRRLVAETIEDGRTFVRRYVYAPQRGVVVFAEPAEDRATTRGALVAAE